ncbi:MAG: hypothetical protein WAL25_02870 [Acidimicrobiia bacterium]
MRDIEAARRALERAEEANDEVDRTVWLAKAADHAISRDAVLVGGAAVNLHTAVYKPTDVDLCAYLDDGDRTELARLGFKHLHGDHFLYTFRDGEKWPVEFPCSVVDGDVMNVSLGAEEVLAVISTESLVLDRIRQATDRTGVTFDEAVRLCRAVNETADWALVERRVNNQDRQAPLLRLRETYERVLAKAR